MRVLHFDRRQEVTRDQYDMALISTPGFTPFLRMDFSLACQVARGEHTVFQFVEAAVVDCMDKWNAFELTNSIDSCWYSANMDRVSSSGLSLRSTSVNDLIVDGNDVFLILSKGYQKLEVSPNELHVRCGDLPCHESTMQERPHA